MESANAILTNQPASSTAISIQQQIDCDNTNQGCTGGWPTRNYKFVAVAGYSLIQNYPYQYLGVQRMCLIQPANNILKFSYIRPRQYVTIDSRTLKYMVTYQPIAVAINAPSCVLNYKSGILS